jgi:hypothetical protein
LVFDLRLRITLTVLAAVERSAGVRMMIDVKAHVLIVVIVVPQRWRLELDTQHEHGSPVNISGACNSHGGVCLVHLSPVCQASSGR